MSRRKQSNPKPLKSEMENSTSEPSGADSKGIGSVESLVEMKPGDADDDWDSDSSTEENPSTSDPEKPLTSPFGQQVAEVEIESGFNLGIELGQSAGGLNLSTRERSPLSMANAGKNSSPRSSSPSVSPFVELPSTSYLAAALKTFQLSAASSTSAEGFGDSRTPLRDRSFSSAEETSAQRPNSKESRSTFQSNPFLNVSLGEAVAISAASLTSSLLKNSTGDGSHLHLSNMMQGFPLLSSVLPALQRLTPKSLSSLSSTGGGIMCVCGVKFNSTSNLEAHRMFYCSQRPVASEGRDDRKEENQSPSRDHEMEASSPPGHILKCPHCNYTTTHKLSLNGHMNIHTNPEDASQPSSFSQAAAADPKAQERYCADCDIQFSSMKTYRVHKLHYCQTRHVLKGAKSPVRDEAIQHIPGLNSIGSTPSNAQLILALPTNPILLLPYSLVAGAQILPPHILPQIGAAFVLPNGQVHPIPAANSHPHPTNGSSSLPPLLSPNAVAAATAAVLASSSSSSASQSNISLSLKCESFHRSRSPKEEGSGKRRGEGDSPLDLTTKRPKLTIKTDLLNDEEKENREINISESSKSLTSKLSFSGGEFEGRLLSSPPAASSPSNEDQSIIKPSRPESVTPSLSPRTFPPESPKPSTSTLSNSSRSPSHSSPVNSSATPSLPHLPPGFPANIVSSLESLGSSLPLASLHCLQSLQNVPRELALKLLSPDLLMKSLPSALNPPVIVKQGEAKCNECNIVFYKEESLQIHKKHYCSARDIKKSLDDERNSNDHSPTNLIDTVSGSSPVRSPVREIAPSSSSSSAQTVLKESPKQSKTLLQFICTACGIKFSSPDNLTAHQTYYCPKREGAGEEGAAKGVWRCPRCRVVMAETMQAAHRCVSPSPTPSHGWKCPCCPVLSPTAAAAQKHLETHSGIKAFRCTICGYRGNTLRGMRTHIRMHFEKRTNDLQEENFIACILDDEEPRSSRASVCSDTRKLLDSTRLLLEKNALSSIFGGENKLSDQVDSPYTCVYCPFIATMQTSLLQHLTLVHNVGLETKISQEIKNFLEAKTAAAEESETKNENEIGANMENSPPLPSVKLEPEVKLEVNDSDDETIYPSEIGESQSSTVSVSAATAHLSNGSPPSSSTSDKCYCHTCKISFSLSDSYTAHKKFYCSRPQSSTPPETTVQ